MHIKAGLSLLRRFGRRPTGKADSEVDVDECDTRSGPRVILPTRPCRPS